LPWRDRIQVIRSRAWTAPWGSRLSARFSNPIRPPARLRPSWNSRVGELVLGQLADEVQEDQNCYCDGERPDDRASSHDRPGFRDRRATPNRFQRYSQRRIRFSFGPACAKRMAAQRHGSAIVWRRVPSGQLMQVLAVIGGRTELSLRVRFCQPHATPRRAISPTDPCYPNSHQEYTITI
jgi:hypothetical protein